jgi:hypothetical protein
MTDTLEAAIPDAEETTQETRTPEQRREALVEERIRKATGVVEDEPEPEAPETDEETDEEEDGDVETPDVDKDDEEEEGEEESDVLSQDEGFDIDELNEEELEALTQQVNAKAGKALTKSRLKEKEWKAEREKLQAQIDELANNVVTTDNPFASVRTVEEADKSIKQAEVNIKGWNRKLITEQIEKYDDAKGEDVRGVMFGDQFIPTAQLLDAIDKEEEKLEPLRNRKSELKKVSESLGSTSELVTDVRGKLNIDENEDAAKEYDSLLGSPKFELVKNIFPDYAKELIELFGRASLTKVPEEKKFSRKLKRKSPKPKTESVSIDTKAGRPAKRSSGTSVEIKKLQKIVTDPTKSIAERRNADQQIRILKTK